MHPSREHNFLPVFLTLSTFKHFAALFIMLLSLLHSLIIRVQYVVVLIDDSDSNSIAVQSISSPSVLLTLRHLESSFNNIDGLVVISQ